MGRNKEGETNKFYLRDKLKEGRKKYKQERKNKRKKENSKAGNKK
jgi:hypothetical protein